MNHLLAVKSRATERYVLNELDEDSRLAFEEHYFCCRDCAIDVKAAAGFVDNAKTVLEETPEKRRGPSLPPFWGLVTPVAVAACLTVGYFLPHPSQHTAGTIVEFAVPAGTRGGGGPSVSERTAIIVDKEAAYYLVRLDVADDVTAPRLLWRVRAADGQVLRFRTARENHVSLPLPAAEFPVGRYEVTLSSDTPGAAIIERFGFAIQPK